MSVVPGVTSRYRDTADAVTFPWDAVRFPSSAVKVPQDAVISISSYFVTSLSLFTLGAVVIAVSGRLGWCKVPVSRNEPRVRIDLTF
jgi:hypothetical protein